MRRSELLFFFFSWVVRSFVCGEYGADPLSLLPFSSTLSRFSDAARRSGYVVASHEAGYDGRSSSSRQGMGDDWKLWKFVRTHLRPVANQNRDQATSWFVSGPYEVLRASRGTRRRLGYGNRTQRWMGGRLVLASLLCHPTNTSQQPPMTVTMGANTPNTVGQSVKLAAPGVRVGDIQRVKALADADPGMPSRRVAAAGCVKTLTVFFRHEVRRHLTVGL